MINVPELRFEEFNKKWDEKNLNEVTCINPVNSKLPESFFYIDLESVENGILNKKIKISKKNAPSRAKRILKENDILYQMVRPYQKNNLFFNYKNENYVASTGYAQIRTKQNPYFIFQIIHTSKFVNNVLKMCTGTSYPAINSSDLGKIKVIIPSINEQEKIAIFLSNISIKNFFKNRENLLT
nr:restriction endonuclease subunit S [Methanobrevibacter arboriphilus]